MRMPPHTVDTAIMCRLNHLAGDMAPGVQDLDAPAVQGEPVASVYNEAYQ